MVAHTSNSRKERSAILVYMTDQPELYTRENKNRIIIKLVIIRINEHNQSFFFLIACYCYCIKQIQIGNYLIYIGFQYLNLKYFATVHYCGLSLYCENAILLNGQRLLTLSDRESIAAWSDVSTTHFSYAALQEAPFHIIELITFYPFPLSVKLNQKM